MTTVFPRRSAPTGVAAPAIIAAPPDAGDAARLVAPARLAAVARSGLLDLVGDDALDRLAAHAARLVRAPVVVITVLDGEQERLAGYSGRDRASLPASIPHARALSRHVVLRGAAVVAPDLAADPLLRAEPAVLDHGLGAYLGVPLADRDGQLLGAICAVDFAARGWSPDDPSLLAGIAGFVRDLVVLAEAERRAAESESRLRSLFEHHPDGVLTADEAGWVTALNPAAEQLLGAPPARLVGRSLTSLLTADEPAALPAMLAAAYGGAPQRGEFALRRADGAAVAVLGTLVPMRVGGEVAGVYALVKDISHRKALERQLRQQAHVDSLTGLANRLVFRTRVEEALAAAAGAPAPAVLFLDLDNFKATNDSFGHAVGDGLLVAAAQRLRECTGDGPPLARLGGDEFAVLLPAAGDEREATQLAERVLRAFAHPLRTHGRQLRVGVSIGIAVAAAGASADDLLRDADSAMYRAKGRGRRRYELFEPAMRAATLRRLELEAELRPALARGELLPHFQPIVALDTGAMVGAEALLRWEHATRGPISPAEIVPIAEESGIIGAIGRMMLQEACREACGWQQPDAAPVTVTVNVSGWQLQQSAFPDEVRAVLAATALPPACLVLELTESMLVGDDPALLERLHAIRALGVGIAIDDFGTGYSSLAYLERFPVTTLKVDKSFVDGLARPEADSPLAGAVVGIARSLRLRVVAEGVETAEQAVRLQGLGCRLGQGYHFARPMPAAGVREYLAAHRHR